YLASVLSQERKLPEAEVRLREALALYHRLLRNDDLTEAVSLSYLADVLREQGKLPESEASYQKAVSMYQRLLGPGHLIVAVSLDSLAGVLREQGKVAEANEVYAPARAVVRKSLEQSLPDSRPMLAEPANPPNNNVARDIPTWGQVMDPEGDYT